MKKITKTNESKTETIIVLSEEDSKMISDLASINTDIETISRSLNINPDSFEEQFMIDGSPINRAVEAGITSAGQSIKELQFEAAKLGDKESIREFKKDAINARWERHKQKLLFDRKLNDYENLKLAIEGKGELPDHLKRYYEVLDFIRTLYSQMNSRSYIVSLVRLKWKELSYDMVVKLYYKSLNFFNADNGVRREAWANIYADQLDMISNLALERGQLDTAGKYKVEAAKMRGVGSDDPVGIPLELLDRRPVFYTFNIADMGLEPVNRRELGSLIDSLNITVSQNTILKKEAGIGGIDLNYLLKTNEVED